MVVQQRSGDEGARDGGTLCRGTFSTVWPRKLLSSNVPARLDSLSAWRRACPRYRCNRHYRLFRTTISRLQPFAALVTR
jgi:hypothetical protein